jgi:hypothetical protein
MSAKPSRARADAPADPPKSVLLPQRTKFYLLKIADLVRYCTPVLSKRGDGVLRGSENDS